MSRRTPSQDLHLVAGIMRQFEGAGMTRREMATLANDSALAEKMLDAMRQADAPDWDAQNFSPIVGLAYESLDEEARHLPGPDTARSMLADELLKWFRDNVSVRNQWIVFDYYVETLSMADMVKKYEISGARINQLRTSTFERLERELYRTMVQHLQDGTMSEQMANVRIENLGLNERALNCLLRAYPEPIRTIGQVLEMTEDDLLMITNFGVKALRELKQKLEDLGLYLKPG